jgi:cytochrome c oxidase assembly factor CtaG
VVSNRAASGLRAHVMLLHAGVPMAPHDLWTAWSFEPAVVASLAAAIGLHLRGRSMLAVRSARSKVRLRRQSAFFLSGCAVLAAALLSPLHRLGGVLFSAHMIQHELLMAVAAPLLVLGHPAVSMLWALPLSFRRSIGEALTRGAVVRLWTIISNPFSAWLLHAVAIWVWHMPGLYDASVRGELVHAAQHLSFVLTALLFWWSVLNPRAQRRGAGTGIISLFTTGIHTTLLGALLATADHPLYAAYTESATRAWGFTPLDDQQLGGVVMWVPAGFVYLAVSLFLFHGWLRESGARVRRLETARRAILETQAARTAAIAFLLVIFGGCWSMSDEQAGELTGGNPHRGADAIRRYGCQSCHSIPGIRGANARVGPPLGGIAGRSYIAGVLANSPDNMITWLRNPPAVDPMTAMPNVGVTEKDARDIAAYLYTLR